MGMPVVHQFTYGAINPAIAFVMALVGALFGLMCTARVLRSPNRWHRVRWLVVAAISLGGIGGWLAHMMAMLGFDVPASPVRYDVAETVLSIGIGIVGVAVGLLIVGSGRGTIARVMFGGLVMGGAIAAMYYVGISAIRLDGSFTYDLRLVAASVLIAVVGSMLTLWITTSTTRTAPIIGASIGFAVAVLAAHYTAMAAVRVHIAPIPLAPTGIEPDTLAVPIVVVATLALLGMLFGGLNLGADDVSMPAVDRDPTGDAAAASPINIEWTIPPRPDDPASLRSYERAYADAKLRHDISSDLGAIG